MRQAVEQKQGMNRCTTRYEQSQAWALDKLVSITRSIALSNAKLAPCRASPKTDTIFALDTGSPIRNWAERA